MEGNVTGYPQITQMDADEEKIICVNLRNLRMEVVNIRIGALDLRVSVSIRTSRS